MEQVEQPTEVQQKIRNHLTAVDVEGRHTDLGIFQFEDKLFIIITQFEKIGTLLLVTPQIGISETAMPDYQVKVLFGIDEIETRAFATFLASSLNITKPLLLGFAIKETVMTPSGAKKLVLKIADCVKKTNTS